jgi:hypothetical protein
MPGPLPALANAAELSKLTGRPANDSQLLAGLAEASRRFRLAVRHPVTLVTAEVLEVDGKGSTQFRLARPFPIVSVASITIDGDLVPAENYRVNKRNGIVTSKVGVWPRPPAAIEVTYTHGYAAVIPSGTVPAGWPADGPLAGLPEDIQSVVLEMAQIVLNTEPGLTGKTVLGDSVTFGSSAVGATQAWSDAVAFYAERTGDES